MRLIIMYHHVFLYLRGVSTNKTIICFIAMQTNKELSHAFFIYVRIHTEKFKSF